MKHTVETVKRNRDGPRDEESVDKHKKNVKRRMKMGTSNSLETEKSKWRKVTRKKSTIKGQCHEKSFQTETVGV